MYSRSYQTSAEPHDPADNLPPHYRGSRFSSAPQSVADAAENEEREDERVTEAPETNEEKQATNAFRADQPARDENVSAEREPTSRMPLSRDADDLLPILFALYMLRSSGSKGILDSLRSSDHTLLMAALAYIFLL